MTVSFTRHHMPAVPRFIFPCACVLCLPPLVQTGRPKTRRVARQPVVACPCSRAVGHELLLPSVAPRNQQLAAAVDIRSRSPAPKPKAIHKAADSHKPRPKAINKEVATHKAAAFHRHEAVDILLPAYLHDRQSRSLVLPLCPHEHPLRPARLPRPHQSRRGRLDRPDARRRLPTARRRRRPRHRGLFPSRPAADRSRRRRPRTLRAGQAALADSRPRGATCAPPASRSSRSVSAARWRRALLWCCSCVRPRRRDRLPRRRHPAPHGLQRPRPRRRRHRRPCRRERGWRAWRAGRSRCS